MPYVYVGRRNFYLGKTLWEICSNLKNFGVGRIVYQHKFTRYPEPSYFKILKVAALPETEPYEEKGITYKDQRKMVALVEKVFRGRVYPEHQQIETITYKNDFRLVPKEEEEAFCRRNECKREPEKIFPAYGEYPPLFKRIIVRNMKLSGEQVNEDPKMKIKYRLENCNYRVAKEGEQPTADLNLMAHKIHPEIYPD